MKGIKVMPTMERVPLNLSNLGDLLDGRVEAMLAVHLKRAAVDCMDRPGEKGRRRVQMTIDVVPVCEAEGYADRAECEIKCTSKLPTHCTTPVQVELNPQGFLFNRNTPDNLDQHSMRGIEGFIPEDEQAAVASPAEDDEPDDDDEPAVGNYDTVDGLENDDVDDDHPDAGIEYDDGENY